MTPKGCRVAWMRSMVKADAGAQPCQLAHQVIRLLQTSAAHIRIRELEGPAQDITAASVACCPWGRGSPRVLLIPAVPTGLGRAVYQSEVVIPDDHRRGTAAFIKQTAGRTVQHSANRSAGFASASSLGPDGGGGPELIARKYPFGRFWGKTKPRLRGYLPVKTGVLWCTPRDSNPEPIVTK
jgi:hypothetical protein